MGLSKSGGDANNQLILFRCTYTGRKRRRGEERKALIAVCPFACFPSPRSQTQFDPSLVSVARYPSIHIHYHYVPKPNTSAQIRPHPMCAIVTPVFPSRCLELPGLLKVKLGDTHSGEHAHLSCLDLGIYP